MRFWLAGILLLWGPLPATSAVPLKAWLEYLQTVEMRVVENGVVVEVNVSTGQRVRKGDLLLLMDQREAKAKLLESKARVARTRIGTEKAQRVLDRTRELYDRGLIAQEELKDAELEQAAAIAEHESAKAFEAATEVALERTELRAPFDGIIVARNVWEGEVVYKTLQQQPLLAMAPSDRMLARALVTAGVLRRLQPGQRAGVNILGELREGEVYSMGVEAVRVELQGAVYQLDVVFDRRPNELLRPSEKVQILLP